MRILTIGDGFAANLGWPQWPEILGLITKNTEVITLGKLGAGNEFIFNSVLSYIEKENVDLVLIQWALQHRLDLVVDNEIKSAIVESDPVYRNNYYKIGHNTWWLSSGSKIDYVTNYHNNYIGFRQAKIRYENYIISMTAILKNKKIPYLYFSTYKMEAFMSQRIDWKDFVIYLPGIGMEEYSRQDRFKTLRGDKAQPSSYVHLCWLNEYVKPKLPSLEWDEKIISELLETYQKTKEG